MKKYLKWGLIILGSYLVVKTIVSVFGVIFGVNIFNTRLPSTSTSSYDSGALGTRGLSFQAAAPTSKSNEAYYAQNQSPPTTDVPAEKRLVIKNGSMAIVVTDVKESLRQIQEAAEAKGGYVVDSTLSYPTEQAYGSITVRIPADKLDDVMIRVRNLALKVSSEQSKADDVTDEYVDLSSRLKNLQATEAQFLEIMKKAGTVEETLQVQSELSNVRGEIEQTKGRMDYYEKSAAMALLQVNVALDEGSLPLTYAPEQQWHPAIVFKRATRSMLGNLRSLGNAAIWLGVYAIIWVPVLLLVIWYRRRRAKAQV